MRRRTRSVTRPSTTTKTQQARILTMSANRACHLSKQIPSHISQPLQVTSPSMSASRGGKTSRELYYHYYQNPTGQNIDHVCEPSLPSQQANPFPYQPTPPGHEPLPASPIPPTKSHSSPFPKFPNPLLPNFPNFPNFPNPLKFPASPIPPTKFRHPFLPIQFAAVPRQSDPDSSNLA